MIFRKMDNNNNNRRNKQTTQISTDSSIKNKRKMNNNKRRNKQTKPISTVSSIKNKIPERLPRVPLEQANKAMASYSVGD